MTRDVVFRPQAEHEALEVRGWYEARREGLGNEFGAEVDAIVARIAANPSAFQRVRGETRRGVLISEVGVNMTRWTTEADFASWLGLCPDNRITGGKVIRKGTRHVVNRAATALRLAATTLLRSQSYLGAQYRRLRGKLGAPKAITAMAHKLARLVYRLLKWGHEYVDKGLQLLRSATP